MSYILDALKKSEAERQQQNLPGFADIPGAARRVSTPVWIWLLAGLLLVNAVVLALLFVNSDSSAGPPRSEAAAPAATSAPAPAEVVNAVRERPANAQPAAADTDTPAVAVRNTPPAQPAVTRTAPPPAATVTSPPATATETSAALPTLMDLRISGDVQLPDLHLDIHVYSQSPDDRFVFINMTKYRERSQLSEGPLVKEIRKDGVVLEYRGREFLLPRE